ncbi:MAG: flagellar motor switch protein FliM [Aquificaceae bacterium]
MPEEFISQEELNLLFETLGRWGKSSTVEDEKVKPLDLSLFDRIHASRIVGLELIFERWINGLRKGLTSLIVTIPDVLKESVSIIGFKDFTTKLPYPCAIGLFNIEPLRGQSFIAIDPKLINIIVSRVFGGSAKPYEVEGREFTRIEIKLIHKLLNICYQELETTFGTIIDAKIKPISIETNPALLTIARPKEKFILLKVKILIEGNEGYLYLALPEASIAPYKDILKGSTDLRSRQVEKYSFKIFQKIPLEVEVILGSSQISFKKLLELKKGDVITLDRLLKEPLEVKVKGIPKFLAFLGQAGKRKAIKIYKYI